MNEPVLAPLSITRPSIYGETRTRLTERLSRTLGRGEAAATAGRRAEALFKSLYRDVCRIDGKSSTITPSLSMQRESFEALEAAFAFVCPVRVREAHTSDSDGSVKFAMEIEGGLLVETVLIPERGRITLCLSTQVGCAQGCRFCQTGRMGLLRSLRVDEIIGQVLASAEWLAKRAMLSAGEGRSEPYGKTGITNIVFMGMGEPLDNLDALLDSIDILVDGKGFGLSHNKVTVSTVGLLPQLTTFLERSQASLALSLHSPFDTERTRVMPVNARHPIAEVLAVLRHHSERYGRRFMFQYTLIRNVNDSPAHADAIADLLEGLPAKVNLIPLNEHEGTAYRRPGLEPVHAFQTRLKARGLVATVRLSKGRDIQAACGQLIDKVKGAPKQA